MEHSPVSLFTVTIAISVLVFIAVGNYAGRKVKNLDDYFVAGRVVARHFNGTKCAPILEPGAPHQHRGDWSRANTLCTVNRSVHTSTAECAPATAERKPAAAAYTPATAVHTPPLQAHHWVPLPDAIATLLVQHPCPPPFWYIILGPHILVQNPLPQAGVGSGPAAGPNAGA